MRLLMFVAVLLLPATADAVTFTIDLTAGQIQQLLLGKATVEARIEKTLTNEEFLKGLIRRSLRDIRRDAERADANVMADDAVDTAESNFDSVFPDDLTPNPPTTTLPTPTTTTLP